MQDTLHFERFKPVHLDLLQLQDEQLPEKSQAAYYMSAQTFSLFYGNQILAVCSVAILTDKHYILSSLIDKRSGAHMTALVRIIKKMIMAGMSDKDLDRISATVRSDFKAGKRLVKMLGFSYEGTMRKYYMGFDYDIYAWVK